tara:strand:+ start:27844 stop:28140 length:297 start_codon:yes stop_codon:yes gene_type:complete
MFPEARDKPIWRVMYDAHTHGGDPVDILKYRAEKAEALLRQIACNTDPVWARKLACDFWGIPASPDGKAFQPMGSAEARSAVAHTPYGKAVVKEKDDE